jgi:hypothetical protein
MMTDMMATESVAIEKNQNSGELVNIRYFRVARIPARNSAPVQVALLSFSQL